MERSPLFLFALKSCRKIVVHSSLPIAAEKWRKKANVNRRKRNTRREQQEKELHIAILPLQLCGKLGIIDMIEILQS